MKKILLFGAGKSATCLIDYLLEETALRGWEFLLADGNLETAQSKIGNAPHAKACGLEVENDQQRNILIRQADIVISLLPPALHFLVAGSCLEFGKNLLTASYVDEKIQALGPEILKKQLLFLCEMGLDPGIDHMSAVELIERIKNQGGRIHSFKSHTGGLVAPEDDNNPWHYKISWNPRNVVLAGSAGAVYRENQQTKTIPYQDLFNTCTEVHIPGLGALAYYPNRDSLGYIPVYALQEADTFIRTTLRYPEFCTAWNQLVKAGLTDEKKAPDPHARNIKQWSAPVLPWVNETNRAQLAFLGLFEDSPLPQQAKSNADILQYLLETRLAMQPDDKDMIVMLHEIDYTLENVTRSLKSALMVKGENNIRTAMAKTVGLPLGIAAIQILLGEITLKGLHIPILPEIYGPVLKELGQRGIRFREVFS